MYVLKHLIREMATLHRNWPYAWLVFLAVLATGCDNPYDAIGRSPQVISSGTRIKIPAIDNGTKTEFFADAQVVDQNDDGTPDGIRLDTAGATPEMKLTPLPQPGSYLLTTTYGQRKEAWMVTYNDATITLTSTQKGTEGVYAIVANGRFLGLASREEFDSATIADETRITRLLTWTDTSSEPPAITIYDTTMVISRVENATRITSLITRDTKEDPWSTDTWKIEPPQEIAGRGFGVSLALFDIELVVGAPHPGGSNGALYLFNVKDTAILDPPEENKPPPYTTLDTTTPAMGSGVAIAPDRTLITTDGTSLYEANYDSESNGYEAFAELKAFPGATLLTPSAVGEIYTVGSPPDVHVYRRANKSWETLTPDPGARYTTHAVTSRGNDAQEIYTVAAHALRATDQSASIVVYSLPSTGGAPTKDEIKNLDMTVSSTTRFGEEIALSTIGDTTLLAAFQPDGGNPAFRPAVYIYSREGAGPWRLLYKVSDPTLTADEIVPGTRLALHEDSLSIALRTSKQIRLYTHHVQR